MRLLHTSDWHLGISLYHLPLLDEQRRMVDQLLQTVREQQVDAVLLAGDVFDHAVSSPEAIRLYNDAMTGLCRDLGVPVLLIPGNHDGAARLAACSALLESAGLYIAQGLEYALRPVLLGDCAFFLLPYFNAEQVRAMFPGENIKSYADAAAVLAGRMREHFVPGKKHILLAHCFAAGAQLSESDRAAQVGGSSQIALDTFDGFDYVALGHLHRAQDMGPGVRYSGSPLCYAFSEAGQEKSFTLLDTETMGYTVLPVKTGRRMRVLSGDFEALLAQAPQDPAPEDYLQVVLEDCPAGMEKLEMLRAFYPHLLLLRGREPAGGQESALTADAISQLSPEQLLRQFCFEIRGEGPDEQELRWFLEAGALQEGEGMQ